jgi:hypothetical protein
MLKKLMLRIVNIIAFAASSQFDIYKHTFTQAAIFSSRSNYPNVKKLTDAELKIYSQWGEDGILDYLCHKLDLERPHFLEVGAGDFQECNSRFLVEYRNASATLVDANPELADAVKKSDLYWKSHLFSFVTWVTTENINEIIQKARLKMNGLDIFSLDLDGNDYWIMKEADLTDFQVVVLEYNSIFGSEKALTIPLDQHFDRQKKNFSLLYFGASLRAYVDLMDSKGFVFVGTNLVRSNAFFVRKGSDFSVTFDLPKELAGFTDCKIRESRDESGSMTYMTLKEGFSLVGGLPVVDLDSGKEIPLNQALGLA